LLARLRRGASESVPVILDFLKSGKDLPRESLVGKDSMYRSNGNIRTLRGLLVSMLVDFGKDDPTLRVEAAKAILPGARSIEEVYRLSNAAETAEPGAIRDLAVEALTRLASEKRTGAFSVEQSMALIVRFQAEELLPIFAKEFERRPFPSEIETFLAALWRFPEETRGQLSQQMMDSEAVRKKMRGYPSSWKWLDFRKADFRAVVVNDFRTLKNEEFQMYLLRALPESTTPGFGIFQGDLGASTPGAPGSREQAISRLALLDELAPYCNTPLLEKHLASSREKLTGIVNKP